MVRARKPNRTDLTGDSRSQEPITVATGQPYGEATQQRDAQRAVPIGTPPTPTTLPMRATSSVPSAPPGSMPFLHPTNRPDEPITAGLPFGPGPGPEVMNNPSTLPSHPVSDQLNQIAQTSTGGVSALADAARMLGL